MMWRELAFILNVLFTQGPEEYPEYWQEEIKTKIQTTKKIDWQYWEPWEFYVAGGSWKVLDDIAIHIKEVYLDSLIDPLPPDDLPGRELKRYYLIVDASLRALSGNKTINPCGDFAIKDENNKTIWTSDYEGRDVNGYPTLGKRVSMYEKLNPGKLKKGYSNDFYVDDITFGAAREFAVSRKMVFAIGENNIYGYGRRIRKYVGNNIWLCHGNASVPLINLEKLGLREGYYEIKRELSKEEIFIQTMNHILSFAISKRPDLAISYRRLNDFSFRSIERRDSGIDSVTHYLKKLVPVSDNCFKMILSNYSHYYDSFSEDSLLVYLKDNTIQGIKVFNEHGETLDLEDVFRNY